MTDSRNIRCGSGPAGALGCGAALAEDPEQVLAKLDGYRRLGIEAFILSECPYAAE